MARWPMSCKHWLIEYFHWLGSEHAGSKLNFKEHSNKVHISHSNKENEHEHIKAMFLLTSVTPQSTAQANKISLRSLWSGSLSCRNHDVTAKTLLCRALIGLDLIYCYLTLPFLWITRDFFSLHIQIYARLYNAAASQPRPLGLGCSLAITNCVACANCSLYSADIGIKVPRHSYRIRADTSCINIQLFIETNILGFKSRTAALECLRCGVSSILMPQLPAVFKNHCQVYTCKWNAGRNAI